MRSSRILTSFVIALLVVISLAHAQFPKPPKGPFPKPPSQKKAEPLSVTEAQSEIKFTQADGQKITLPISIINVPSDFKIINTISDSSSTNIFLFVQGFGRSSEKKPMRLICYDYKNRSVLWQLQTKNRKGFLASDLLILPKTSKYEDETIALDKKTGDIVWKNEEGLYLPILSKNIGFSGSMCAVDLRDGSERWCRKINNNYGWLEGIILDSMMIVSIDGLHTFDLFTGSGWDLELPTVKKDISGYIAKSIAAGFAQRMGLYVEGPSQPDVYSGLASNILLVGNRVYFSAIDIIVSREFGTGQVIWTKRLPEPNTGSAFLFPIGEDIGFINIGSCMLNNSLISYYYPYLLIMDKNTGSVKYNVAVKTIYPICDYMATDTLLHVISSKDLMSYNNRLQVVSHKTLHKDTLTFTRTGDYVSVLNHPENYFIIRAGSDSCLPLSFFMKEGYLPVISQKGLIIYNELLQEKHWIPQSELYKNATQFSNYLVLKPRLEHLSKRYIVDNTNELKIVGKIDLPGSQLITEDTMIFFPEINSFGVFDLPDLIKK